MVKEGRPRFVSVYVLVEIRKSWFTSEDEDQISGEPPLKTVCSKPRSTRVWPQIALTTSPLRVGCFWQEAPLRGWAGGLPVGAAIFAQLMTHRAFIAPFSYIQDSRSSNHTVCCCKLYLDTIMFLNNLKYNYHPEDGDNWRNIIQIIH